MNISIFGLGYVGCVGLGCLAKNGHNLIGVDVSQTKVNLINQGKPTIIEKDVDKLISEGLNSGRIRATHDYKDAVHNTDISFIAVGTPSTDDGHLNLDYIYKVAEEIGEALRTKEDFHIVIIRSTVLPGTNKRVSTIIEAISGKKCNVAFAVVSNPEFLREGTAVYDYYNPPVTVIGSESEYANRILGELYGDLQAPLQFVEINVAEIIKYVNNSWHALKIVFANEVGNICKKLEIDSHKVMEIFVMDKQLNLSPYYLKPGFAYGGSCLPKDLKGLKTIAHDFYISSPVLDSIEESNTLQKKRAINLIEKYASKKVGILGLSFKEGTDDLRYSPIVEVSEYLIGKGYSLSVYDKNVTVSKLTGTNKDYIEKAIPHISDLVTDNIEKVVLESEILVITHKIPGVSDLITKYPEKTFIDLVRVTDEIPTNYEGICW